ncbi:MAG: hypothetical protein ACFCA4_09190 [Cyanophyceae cyanobacterium]
MLNSTDVLSYRTTSHNASLSFEIRVNDRPIGEFFYGKSAEENTTPVPFRLFRSGLGIQPVQLLGADPEKKVVAVCSCGQWGCGSVRCDVVKSWDNKVVFTEFTVDPMHSKPFDRSVKFVFLENNYDAVASSIFREVNEYKGV